jgi:hypothetical protein
MMNHPFTEVRNALRGWLTQYSWINLITPYHLYLMFGSVGYMFLYQIITDLANRYIHILAIVNSIAYWTFLLGLLLTLISRNVKYLPYGLLIYIIQYLYPFAGFSFGSILRAAIFAALTVGAFLYSAKVNE